MPYVELPAGRFFYRYDGPTGAPLIVLSHSLGADCSMWERQMPAFTRQFRVLRYDSRGHGRSASPRGPYTIEDLGQDALDLYRALGINRTQFCGLSMGGMVGMWLAANAPECVDRLGLCNTAARLRPPQLWDARIDAVRSHGMAAVVQAVLARWFTPAFINANPSEIAAMRHMLETTPAPGYIASCEAIRDMDQRAMLSRITAPTLVVAGALDAATPPDDGRFLASAIPGARYIELSAAHLSNIEATKAFNDAVLRFFSGEDVGE
ncbi:MAG TPA: 3-oxoadipate enol-lactonase [Ktedonobacterales bacterium]